MAETADQIRAAIEERRADLDAKLDMLEARARHELSLRTQFSRRPWQALGAAAGAGVVLGLLFGGRSKMRDHQMGYVEYDPEYDEEFVDD